jgi:hypothetical protein
MKPTLVSKETASAFNQQMVTLLVANKGMTEPLTNAESRKP